MNKKGYILPLGSVVMLKDGDVLLMIVGRAQLFNNNGTIGYFDYSALAYPQGVTSNQEYAFFNDEDIKKVVFEGFRNDQEIEFADSYEQNVEKASYPKLHLEN